MIGRNLLEIFYRALNANTMVIADTIRCGEFDFMKVAYF